MLTPIMLLNLGKLFFVAVIAVLYRLGGSDEAPKAVRRFGCPIMMFLALMFLIGLSWQLLVSCILYAVTLTLPYGVKYHQNKTWKKVFLRGIGASMMVVSFLPIAMMTGAWLMFAIQCLVIPAVVILGVKNPVDAETEEMLIGGMTISMVLFYV